MAELGNFLLWLSLIVSIYAVASGVLAGKARRMDMVISTERALGAAFALVLGSGIILAWLLLTDRFDISYVAHVSSREQPMIYKITSFWSSMEGSLLLWLMVLCAYSFLSILFTRRFRGPLPSYAAAIMAASQVFFAALIAIYENPFESLGFTPPDGQGMNPLLVNPYMATHPPMLYSGFVGFIVPYAFAMAALISRQVDDEWIRTTRRWTVIPWFFLGVGQLLGGKWAYVVLGWGGYWGWDPVENAALLPWLTATAFLHSVMIQEKKGMLRVWNMVLILLTFTLCIFGTFITRSGLVSSVHTFAQSPIGPWFLRYVLAIIFFSTYFLWTRVGLLKSRNEYESPVSREGSFLLNNLLFVTATFAVFWGVIFPVISEAVTGDKITVGPPFFNTVMVPIGLLLLLLTGVGPLLAWRKTSGKSLRKYFTGSGIVGLLCGLLALALGIQDIYALISFTFCGFVTATIVSEFHRGAKARGSSSGESYLTAVINLTLRNRRRYGGYIVHFGIVLIFIGFTGNAFNEHIETELKYMESAEIGPYRLVYEGVSETTNPFTAVIETQLGLYNGEERIGTLFPEQHVYYKRQDQQRTTEVAIRSTFREDVYALAQGFSVQDGEEVAFFHFYLNPLVLWVWIGAWVLTIGTIITMLPDRQEQARRGRIGLPEASGRKVPA